MPRRGYEREHAVCAAASHARARSKSRFPPESLLTRDRSATPCRAGAYTVLLLCSHLFFVSPLAAGETSSGTARRGPSDFLYFFFFRAPHVNRVICAHSFIVRARRVRVCILCVVNIIIVLQYVCVAYETRETRTVGRAREKPRRLRKRIKKTTAPVRRTWKSDDDTRQYTRLTDD